MIEVLENLRYYSGRELYDKFKNVGDPKKIEGLILDIRSIDLDDYPYLKVISRNGVGLDNLDLAECEKRNIKVCITICEELSIAVAEHALYLVLRVLKNKGELLINKQVGIIGFGRIGYTFYRMIKPLTRKSVLTYDILNDSNEQSRELFKKKLLNLSDIIVVCVSGNEEVIGQKELDMMKDRSYIVNVARDKCINDSLITSAILNGYKVAGYASDVNDDNRENKLLYEKYNIIYTDHVASLPAKAVMEKQCVDNLYEGLKEWKK